MRRDTPVTGTETSGEHNSMDDNDLTARQQAALLTLMAEAREMTNRELRDVAGAELERKDRERLLAIGYVSCQTDRAPYVHELTPAGWSWCQRFLSTGRRIQRSGPSATLAVLRGLDRHLRDSTLSLRDVFRPSLEDRIRAAYARAARRPGALVSLAVLRPLLADVARDEIGETLDHMITLPDVRLSGETNQKTLSDDDRKAAVEIGGELKHYLAIEPA